MTIALTSLIPMAPASFFFINSGQSWFQIVSIVHVKKKEFHFPTLSLFQLTGQKEMVCIPHPKGKKLASVLEGCCVNSSFQHINELMFFFERKYIYIIDKHTFAQLHIFISASFHL